MEFDEKRKLLREFVDFTTPELKGNLASALYSMNELRLWPDYIDSVSEEQAILCWAIIEKLRIQEFPAELQM